MHELSIAQNILDIIRQSVPPPSHAKIRFVDVKVGVMSGVVAESLSFSFAAIIQDTDLASCAMNILEIPYVIRCHTCAKETSGSAGLALCPECGGLDTEVLSGMELEIQSIHLEEEDQPA